MRDEGGLGGSERLGARPQGLKAGAISYVSNVVIGTASVAPTYSLGAWARYRGFFRRRLEVAPADALERPPRAEATRRICHHPRPPPGSPEGHVVRKRASSGSPGTRTLISRINVPHRLSPAARLVGRCGLDHLFTLAYALGRAAYGL